MGQTIAIEDLVSEDSFEPGADNTALVNRALGRAQARASQADPIAVLLRQQITVDQSIICQPGGIGFGPPTAWHDVGLVGDFSKLGGDRPPGFQQLSDTGPDPTWEAVRDRGTLAFVNTDRCFCWGLDNGGGKPDSSGKSAPPTMWMNPTTHILYSSIAEAGAGAIKKRTAKEGQYGLAVIGSRDFNGGLIRSRNCWGDGFKLGPFGSGTKAIPCERIEIAWIEGRRIGRELLYFTGTKHAHIAVLRGSIYNGVACHSESGGNKLLDQEDIVIEQVETDGSSPDVLQLKGETAMRGFALRGFHTTGQAKILLYAPLRDGEKILQNIEIADLSWDATSGEILTPWNVDGLSLSGWKGPLSKRVTLIDQTAGATSQPIAQTAMGGIIRV